MALVAKAPLFFIILLNPFLEAARLLIHVDRMREGKKTPKQKPNL